MNKLKLLDLFSGIGGFSLGFEKTGEFETVAFCEKEKFCQSVLKKNWKNIRIYDEVRNLKGIQADVITGGFPCQPFSNAGKRKGTDDDRYLWDETLRVITETKPKWFVGENVEGIVNISEGKVLQQIQKDLESEGFQVQCLIISASGIGAWHQRKRVWIIANSNTGLHIGENKEIQARRIASYNGGQDVSNSDSMSRYNLRGQQSKQTQTTFKRSGIGSSTQTEQQTWWQTQSELCGVPHGISYELDKDRANRIKALGNSIVPEIAYEIAKAIWVAENEQSQLRQINQCIMPVQK